MNEPHRSHRFGLLVIRKTAEACGSGRLPPDAACVVYKPPSRNYTLANITGRTVVQLATSLHSPG
jgi:hypothetical protein